MPSGGPGIPDRPATVYDGVGLGGFVLETWKCRNFARWLLAASVVWSAVLSGQTILPGETAIPLVLYRNGLTAPFPVTSGVPLPAGLLRDEGVVSLFAAGKEIPLQRQVTARWHTDGSIKWLLLDFIAPPGGSGTEPLVLILGRKPAAAGHGLSLSESEALAIDTGVTRARILRRGFNLIEDLERLQGGVWAPVVSKAGSRGGPYCIDGRSTAFYASGDTGAEVRTEESGPIRATVRGEGWHVSAYGEKNGRFLTRVSFFAGLPLVRVDHTFTITVDTDKETFRDIGLSLAGFRARTATFGPETRRWAAPAWATQYEHDRYALFSGGERKSQGARLNGHLRAENGSAALSVSLADCWQKYPKELEAGADALVFHLWPAHAVAVDAPTITEGALDRLWHSHHGETLLMSSPPAIAQFPVGGSPTATEKRLRYARASAEVNGMGVAITLQCLIDASGDYPLETLSASPPVCVVDPAWMCRSGAFGPLSPANHDALAPVEEAMVNAFAWERRMERRWDDFGMWIYGNGHTYWRLENPSAGRMEYDHLDRGWRNMHHGYPRVPWLLFAMTGDPAYLQAAKRNTAFNLDVGICHWEDEAFNARYPESSPLEFKRKVKGAQTDYKGILPWSAGGRIGDYNAMTDFMLYDFFLTGNRRAREVALEWGACMKTNRRAPLEYAGRGWMGPLDALLQLHLATGDREYLDLARAYAVEAGKAQGANGVFTKSHWWTYAPGIVNYARETGDPKGKEMLLRWADSFLTFDRAFYPLGNPHETSASDDIDYTGFSGFPHLDVLAEAYRMSGRPDFLKSLKGKMLLVADSIYRREGSAYDGLPIWNTTSLYGYFLQGAPRGLEALRSAAVLAPEYPRWDQAGDATLVLGLQGARSAEVTVEYAMPNGRGLLRLEDPSGATLQRLQLAATEPDPTSLRSVRVLIPADRGEEFILRVSFENPQSLILLPLRPAEGVKCVKAVTARMPVSRASTFAFHTEGKATFDLSTREGLPASCALHDLSGARLDYASKWDRDLPQSLVLATSATPPGALVTLAIGLSVKGGIVNAQGVGPWCAPRAREFFTPTRCQAIVEKPFSESEYEGGERVTIPTLFERSLMPGNDQPKGSIASPLPADSAPVLDEPFDTGKFNAADATVIGKVEYPVEGNGRCLRISPSTLGEVRVYVPISSRFDAREGSLSFQAKWKTPTEDLAFHFFRANGSMGKGKRVNAFLLYAQKGSLVFEAWGKAGGRTLTLPLASSPPGAWHAIMASWDLRASGKGRLLLSIDGNQTAHLEDAAIEMDETLWAQAAAPAPASGEAELQKHCFLVGSIGPAVFDGFLDSIKLLRTSAPPPK